MTTAVETSRTNTFDGGVGKTTTTQTSYGLYGNVVLPASTLLFSSSNIFLVGDGNKIFGEAGITTGTYNLVFGDYAGTAAGGGDFNSSFGISNANVISTGTFNTLFGSYLGGSITTGSSNVLVGDTLDVSVGAATNQIAIGGSFNAAGNNSWQIGSLGTKQHIAEGANGCMGAATLVTGTVTVSTTRVTANSRIFLTAQNSAGTVGSYRVSARVAGTGFTILSSSGTDTSLIAWEIKEPN